MRNLLKTLLRNEQGNVLPIGAAGLLLLLVLVGSGVDMSRAYRAQQRLQAACDAATLAGRRSVGSDGFDAAAEAVANNYFAANFHEDRLEAQGTEFVATSEDSGNTVQGVATTRINTVIMRVFGFDQIDLSTECLASMGVGNSDVTMVLDTTGSMNQTLASTSMTRIEALREAMQNFYDTVATATSSGNARIRYSFVPYSSTVNVGQILLDLDSDYLADSNRIHSRRPVYKTITKQVFDRWSDPVATTETTTSTPSYTSWTNISSRYSSNSDCTAALPSDTAWANSGSSTASTSATTNGSGQEVTTTTVTQPQAATFYRCSSRYIQKRTGSRNFFTITASVRNPVYRTEASSVFDYFQYAAFDFDTSLYKNFETVSLPIGPDGVMQDFLWDGCIEERATTNASSFSYSSLTGFSPSSATDLDFDTAPSIIDNDSKWRPLWRHAAYYRTTTAGGSTTTNNATSLYGKAASSACPRAATLLAEMSEEEFDAYAQSLTTGGNTYHDIGLIWGARLSSPDGMFSSLVTDDPDNGAEVSRHLIFMTDGTMEPNNLVNSAYGIEYHNRRITTNGTTETATTRHNARFLAVCEGVKAKGIRLWVIVFGTSLTTPLRTCASPDSIFTATDSNQLNTAFQEIAKKVGELRVVQ